MRIININCFHLFLYTDMMTHILKLLVLNCFPVLDSGFDPGYFHKLIGSQFLTDTWYPIDKWYPIDSQFQIDSPFLIDNLFQTDGQLQFDRMTHRYFLFDICWWFLWYL